jgi:hypothetical protein
MAERVLVSIELRFTSEEDTAQIGDRVREAVSMVVGREALEDFRLRVLPLTTPSKKPRGV